MEPSPWFILLRNVSRAPRIPLTDRYADLSIDLEAPPHLSFLNVFNRIFPTHPQASSPRVIAADLSGCLILTTYTDHFVVLDFASASATALRVPGLGDLVDSDSLGVISAPDRGGGFMVVGLQYKRGDPAARLHCYSSRTGRWATKGVTVPEPSCTWTWAFNDVISHGGRLWWVDTATNSALLACDPFGDGNNPSMDYIGLPDHAGDVSEDDDYRNVDSDVYARFHGFCRNCSAGIPFAARRCVQVVNGKLHWLQMLCRHMSRDGAPSVIM